MGTGTDKTATRASGRPVPFVVLFEARAGSTYFVEALSSHPCIRAEYELFSTIRKHEGSSEDQIACVTDLWQMTGPPAKVAGFKTKLVDILDPDAFARLMKEQTVRVILLQRRNRIKRIVSLMNAMRLNEVTGDWNLYRGDDRRQAFTIDVDEFADWLRDAEQSNRELRRYAEGLGLPTLELFYEDLLTDRDAVFARACEFLGVEEARLEGRCVKHTADDLRLAVSNFDELRARFVATPYEPMFDEVICRTSPQS